MDKQTCLEILTKEFSKGTFGVYCGFTIEETECGACLCSMPANRDFFEMDDRVSEGLIETLADNTAGVVTWSTGAKCVTQSLSCHFLRRRVKGDRILARGTLVGKTEKAFVVEVDIRDDGEGSLARACLTMFRIGDMIGIPSKW